MKHTVVILTLLLMASLAVGKPQEETIMEADGVIVIEDTINIEQIHGHLQTWTRETVTAGDKLTRLLAGRAMRDADKLIAAIKEQTRATWTGNKPVYNQHERFKRNILGDLIHHVTGLATDDELKKQIKIDEEIRDRITTTLTRQVAFEKTLANVYGNLSREEEDLHRRVGELEIQRKQDKVHMLKILALSQVAKDDLQVLEDAMHALIHGQVNTRLSLKLAYKIGIHQPVVFKLVNYTTTDKGLNLCLQADLYRETPVEIFNMGPYQLYTTNRKQYLVHNTFHTDLHLTREEVTFTNNTCEECALLVHLGYRSYRTVQAGSLVCSNEGKQLKNGALLKLAADSICWNSKIHIGSTTENNKVFRVDLTKDSGLDALLFQKLANTSKPQTGKMTGRDHLQASLQLQHDLAEAQQGVENFIQETKTNMETDYQQDYVTWGVLALVTITVIGICGCILVNIVRNRGQNST